MRAHTQQSLLLPAGCCTCAAWAVASRCSAPSHSALWLLGAMRIVGIAMSRARGHWGGAPDTTGWSSGSSVNRMSGARRWWAVQCRMLGVSDRSRYTVAEPPSSTYLAMRRAAGVWSCSWPSHPSFGSITARGARHCATSVASATTSSLRSTVGSAVTRKWCLGPGLLEDCPPILRVLDAKKQIVGTHRSRKHNLQHQYAPKFAIFHKKTVNNGHFLVKRCDFGRLPILRALDAK